MNLYERGIMSFRHINIEKKNSALAVYNNKTAKIENELGWKSS